MTERLPARAGAWQRLGENYRRWQGLVYVFETGRPPKNERTSIEGLIRSTRSGRVTWSPTGHGEWVYDTLFWRATLRPNAADSGNRDRRHWLSIDNRTSQGGAMYTGPLVRQLVAAFEQQQMERNPRGMEL